MAKTCKYKKQYQYVSYDNGLTWRKTGETRRGSLIEENSQECGYIPPTLYRWELVDGEYMCGDCSYKPDSTPVYKWETVQNDYICEDYAKYEKQEEYTSTNGGNTWNKTGNSRIGNLIEQNSSDCGYKPDPSDPHNSPYYNQYLTIEALESGDIKWYGNFSSSQVSYSVNNGAWSTLSRNFTLSVNAGDIVRFKGNCITSYDRIGDFMGNTLSYNVYGNIHSLFYEDDFAGNDNVNGTAGSWFYRMFENTKVINASNLILPATTLAHDCYSRMFYGCKSLTKAPVLPATTLDDYCYQSMFQGCTSLQEAPTLPSTTLAIGCYFLMFQNCTSLTKAPVLPATKLPTTTGINGCYESMFQGCTSLQEAPELPATTIASYCYCQMFYGCKSLTKVPSILPATTLFESCYDNMFFECESLTKAPILPATNLTKRCYYQMFDRCYSLNEITTMQLDEPKELAYSETQAQLGWVTSVAKTGTIYLNKNITWNPENCRGSNGIPNGWTVVKI